MTIDCILDRSREQQAVQIGVVCTIFEDGVPSPPICTSATCCVLAASSLRSPSWGAPPIFLAPCSERQRGAAAAAPAAAAAALPHIDMCAAALTGCVAATAQVNMPKQKNTFCRKCKKHTKMKVSQYKTGKASIFAQGA
jgi:hypothetical protein